MEAAKKIPIQEANFAKLYTSQDASSEPECQTGANNRAICEAEREAVIDEHTGG